MDLKKRWNFHSLTITLAIAFFSLSIIVLVLFGIINVYFSIQAQQRAINSQQQMIASGAADSVKNFITERFSELQSGTRLSNLAVADLNKQKILLERLIGTDQAFRQLMFLDPHGTEITKVSRLSSFSSSKLQEQISSDLILLKEKEYIGQVYIDDITSEPLVILSVPIKDIFGDLKGILLAEVNLKFMWDLVGSIKVGESGLAYVVDNLGNLVAFEDISRVLKRENLAELKEVSDFLEGKSLLSEETHTHYSNVEINKGILNSYVVTTHEHLDSPDWAVVVELPVLEAYKNVITLIELSLFIMTMSIIMAISVAIFLSKKITNPIIRLRDAATEIGRGRLDTKIDIKAKNEIGQLADSFEQMTRDLKKSRAKLEDYSLNLEQKVKQRTKQLEIRDRKLSESEKRYDLVVKTTGQLVYDLNLKTNKIIWKGAIKEITGYLPHEFKLDLDEWSKTIHPKDSKKAVDTLNKAIRQKGKYSVEYRFRQKKGSYKYISDTGFFIEDKTGKVVRMLGTMKDISKQKKFEDQILKFNYKLQDANQKLKDLDKQKDAFISIAAHELKTPLTSIKGFTELLQNKKFRSSDKKRVYYLNLINKNTDRLYRLVLDLVDSSRISLGQIKMAIETVDVYDVFKEIKETMEQLITKKGLKAEFVIEENLPKIKADNERLLQVLRNLIINALHYTENGSISLNIYRGKKHVQFEVRDTGQGIPKDAQTKIFSRFYQVDSSMKRKVGGSGLGLSVCKGLVDLMKGKIWFESEPGKGTTFYFTVPIK